MRWKTIVLLWANLFFLCAAGQIPLDKAVATINTDEAVVAFLDKQTIVNEAELKQLLEINNKYSNGLRSIAVRAAIANQKAVNGEVEASSRWYEAAIQTAQNSNSHLLDGYLNYKQGRFLYERGNTAKGIEHLFYAQEMLTPVYYKAIPSCGSYLSFIGNLYCTYQDFPSGLNYLKASLQYNFSNPEDKYYAYGALGLVYYQLNKADSSILFSKAALQVAAGMKDSATIGDMSGNLGAGFLLNGSMDSALHYLNIDYRLSSKSGKWGSACGALIMQAKIYLLQKNVVLTNAALRRVDSIYSFCDCATTFSRLDYYKYLFSLYRLQGNFRQAVAIQDSIDKYNSLTKEQKKATSFRNLELAIVKRVNETKIDLLESERKRQVYTRNSLIALAVFSLIIFGQVLYRQRQKRKDEHKIFELKLHSAEQQLQAYLNNIRDKNRILEELTEELNQKQSTETAAETEENNLEVLAKIKNASLLTDKGWNEFVQLVDRVHRHFFIKLEQKMPGLTPSETRLLTLVKLNFSNKEMAGMLGISIESVTKAKQRLKKKLFIEGDIKSSIEDYVKTV